ncbi:MAG: penicillin-binding protein 2, partial [Candidatus Woesebacteria bacterium]|nr:penicillin-binding protein 2 [Candidatus Woesebacteria bacterium]
KADVLSNSAKGQYQVGQVMEAPRGNILAVDGSSLVMRRDAWLLFAEPPNLKEKPEKIAEKLAPILEKEVSDILLLLSKKGSVWVPLEHKLSTGTKGNIEALGFSGLGFEKEEDRYYPEASVAAQLLGFVGKNEEGGNVGYFGLEGYYDLTLSGKKGYREGDSDAKGIPILLGNFKESSALNGVDLVTTIDKTVQLTIEKKLKEGIEKYGAIGGSVVVMDPKSGKILGMASYPSFDPRKYNEYGDVLFKNPVISDTFEPGSIFKVLIMASALDAKAVKPDTICDICSGPLKVDKYEIETWDNKYYPDSTMTDVILHSDNVGMTFVGGKLGADTLYDYLDKFGIGKETGIDLQGEVAVPLRKKGTWNIVDLATASFGQGVAVTSIEMIRAVAGVANDGMMPTPYVVSTLKGEGWQEEIKPKTERVISEKAAEEMTTMMVGAAKNGESKWTSLRGFSVAGKTGTAQIPIAGHYDPKSTNASFIGFSPAGSPKFIMLVTLNKPQSSQWASETAAPLWYSIAKDLFLYFGIQPEN